MAPKRRRTLLRAKAKAKSKAEQREARKMEWLAQRREAIRELNQLATEHGLDDKCLRGEKIRSPSSSAVHGLIKLLEPRCAGSATLDRLRAAVKKWADNHGTLEQPMVEDAPGASATAQDVPALPRHRILQPGFVLKSKAFMLIFHSRDFSLATWPAFASWVKERAECLGARAWACCLEENNLEHAVDGVQRYHLHAYFYWTDGVGLFRRSLDDLKFQNLWPRVEKCLGASNVTPRVAACHGLWYVTVKKLGTRFEATNYKPYVHYHPKTAWLQSLWEAKKLTHSQYLSLSQNFRTGHGARKREVQELLRDEKEVATDALIAAELSALQKDAPLRSMKTFGIVERFIEYFRGKAFRRRPFLVLVGATELGKSLLAADVLRRIATLLGLPGFLEVTVESDGLLDLSELDVQRHAGVLLDGVGDILTLRRNREALQGRPKKTKGGKSATMMYAYEYTLCRRAVVVTCDLSASNLHLLRHDHWFREPSNVLTLWLEEYVWEGSPAPQTQTPQERMASWNVDETQAFLKMKDLAGPATYLSENGVNGNDLVSLNLDTLTNDLRCTPFAARKVLAARDGFLQAL